MSLEITPEMMIEAMALGFQRELEKSGAMDLFAERVADKICERFELLTPRETAALLDFDERTLREKWQTWGLDKSVAFGASNPRFFLSQVLERARAKVIKGRSQQSPGVVPHRKEVRLAA
jgi:hypothetical protein